MSAPQIAFQAASPRELSPASEDESAEAERESATGYVNQMTFETEDLVEDHGLEREEDSTKPSGLEMPQDSDSRTEMTVTVSEELFEEVKSASADDQTVAGDEEEEPIEGRLSADTAEQIFISQQIEAKAALDQQQPSETALPVEDPTLGFEESEHVPLPTDSLDVASSAYPLADIDQLQSPYKTSTGSICPHYHNYNIHIFSVELVNDNKICNKNKSFR